MVKSYLIDGKSISSNSKYRGTALRAVSRFGESWLSYCTGSLTVLHPESLPLKSAGPKYRILPPNLNNNWITGVIGWSRHVTGWAIFYFIFTIPYLDRVKQTLLWNSISTSFVFTELANTRKYEGGFLYNLVFTEWRHCVSQNIQML